MVLPYDFSWSSTKSLLNFEKLSQSRIVPWNNLNFNTELVHSGFVFAMSSNSIMLSFFVKCMSDHETRPFRFFVFEMWSNSMSSVQYGSLPFSTDVCVKKTNLNNDANTEMFGYANAIQRHSGVMFFFGLLIIRMYTIVRTWSSGPFVGTGSEVFTFCMNASRLTGPDMSSMSYCQIKIFCSPSYPVQDARDILIAVCEV